jgi:hypothetical protein
VIAQYVAPIPPIAKVATAGLAMLLAVAIGHGTNLFRI